MSPQDRKILSKLWEHFIAVARNPDDQNVLDAAYFAGIALLSDPPGMTDEQREMENRRFFTIDGDGIRHAISIEAGGAGTDSKNNGIPL